MQCEGGCQGNVGYQRSFVLTGPGLCLHFWKSVLYAKVRNVELPSKTVGQAKKCEIYLDKFKKPTKQEVHKKVRDTRLDLWQVQKMQLA